MCEGGRERERESMRQGERERKSVSEGERQCEGGREIV